MASLYTCINNDITCPQDCVGLENCEACNCAVLQSGGGPWGNAMDVIMCLLPIVFLLAATLWPKPLPTTISLPLAALLMFLVRLMYLGSDPLLSCAAVVLGIHDAFTPLSIMAGAIMLFETMEATNCMPYMMREMKVLTNGHPVAELILMFSFAYMIEGASGFGTPAALGAPMLVSLGHPKFESVVTLLLMNMFATVWGAVGTPIWFGFGSLDLGEGDEGFSMISYKAGVALAFAAFLLMPAVLTITIPFRAILSNGIFVFLGLCVCVLPSLGLSFVSYEFPSLIGGMLGMGLNTLLIRFRVGLKPVELRENEMGVHPHDIGTVSERSIVSGLTKSDRYFVDNLMKKIQVEGGDCEKTQKNQVDREEGETKSTIFFKNEEIDGNKANFDQDETKDDDYHDTEESDADLEKGENDENSISNKKLDGIEASTDKSTMRSDDVNNEGEELEMRESQRAVLHALGPRKAIGEGYLKDVIMHTFPLWGTVLILVFTRVPQVGLRRLLTKQDPHFSIHFGTYGTFEMSVSLVLQLRNILTYPNINWKYELLYVPFLVPFVLVSFITMMIFRKNLNGSAKDIISIVTNRLKKPAIALLGALTLVQLMIMGGEASPASIIGTILSDAFKEGFIAISAFLGALGSFFSGSTTVSNLTFGSIQLIAAETIGTSTTSMLALQAAGASAGNAICLNNIIAACAVVGLTVGEGKIIGKTFKFVFGFVVIATLVMLTFFLRFGKATL